MGKSSDMHEWKKKFDAVALEKGKRLYAEGKVQDIQKSDASITASLPGVHSYNVTITLRGEEPVRMRCQCPKARGGRYCEHMAAVLYAAYGDDGEPELPEEQPVYSH